MAKMSSLKPPTVFEQLETSLASLDGLTGKAGWFPGAVYPNGLSVAANAATQEFGAHIAHPGGTPYKIGADGKAVFVTRANGAGLPVTKPHSIVIPPRPFMRPTVDRMKQKWLDMLADGSKAVLAGKISAHDVMEAVVSNAATEIARSISQVFAPPLKASTIAAKRRKMANTHIVGSLDKPLVETRLMIDSVTGVVEKK